MSADKAPARVLSFHGFIGQHAGRHKGNHGQGHQQGAGDGHADGERQRLEQDPADPSGQADGQEYRDQGQGTGQNGSAHFAGPL